MKGRKIIDAIEFAAKVAVKKPTQAILAKAFRGELVPTEAELACREGHSYEPAPTLLAQNDCVTGKRRITEVDLATTK
ncbi:MAG: hypothetical protein QME78_03075 [Thermodesulfobacteriota bacterium]|nr:hypothetical protein [Thermodesulfobacteriota bacterium]